MRSLRVASATLLLAAAVSACSDGIPSTEPEANGDVTPVATSPSFVLVGGGGSAAALSSRLFPNMCVDVVQAAPVSGSTLEMWSCNSKTSQQFIWKTSGEIVPVANQGLCLVGTLGRGDVVGLLPCNGSQRWTASSAGEIKGATGNCIGMFSAVPVNGTKLEAQNCRGTAYQQWDNGAVQGAPPPPPPPSPPPSPPPPGVACSGVNLAVGANFQAAVNANPAGTTFCIAAGTHSNQNVLPKSRDTFRCAPGAILTGNNTTQYAFRSTGGDPDSVTIVGCIIELYNAPWQSGAIQAGWELADATTGWVVDSNEIRENKTGGIRIGSRMKIRGNNIHHNHIEGIVGAGRFTLVENNHIHFNNYLKEAVCCGVEGGGAKFVHTDSLVVRGNYVHDNWGQGLWTDTDNIRTLYEGNRVEDNSGGGIFHEISRDAVIRNNTAKRNGFAFDGWVWGGGIQVATSENVEIYGNTVENNKVGISVVAQPRGSGTYGTFVTRNINVHDNTVTQQTGELSAAAHSPVDNSWYDTIKFTNNRYFTRTSNPSQFCWLDGQYRSWAQWKGFGNDTGGSLTFIP